MIENQSDNIDNKEDELSNQEHALEDISSPQNSTTQNDEQNKLRKAAQSFNQEQTSMPVRYYSIFYL